MGLTPMQMQFEQNRQSNDIQMVGVGLWQNLHYSNAQEMVIAKRVLARNEPKLAHTP